MTDDVLTVELPGIPKGKGRPRFARATGRAYTPAATRNYEGNLAVAASAAMASRPLIEGPVDVIVEVGLPVPASWSRTKQLRAIAREIWPTGRPDVDNYLKAAMDAFNGVVFRDDSQVVQVWIVKFYSLKPSLSVTVRPVVGDVE
jgi:Holliday junction resolvase RusA-like endonuclease